LQPYSASRRRLIRPEWEFRLGLEADVPACDAVLCFEVLIHQETLAAYRRLIEFIATRTRRFLLVSGYRRGTEEIRDNPMLYFHEPLEASLAATGRFGRVRGVGSHSDVVVYRCDV
jgi:hypothetical protein